MQTKKISITFFLVRTSKG